MNQFFLLKGIYTQLQFIIMWGCRNGKRKVESEKQWEYIPFKLTRIVMEKLLVSVCRTRKIWSFFIIKPTRCNIFPNLFWHETLHVSGSSCAHHQEFIHCKSALVCVIQDGTQFHPGPARKLSSNLYDIYQYRVYSE